MIRNCPQYQEDSVRADHIYGPVRTLLQEGMKRRRNPYKRVPRVTLTINILLHHKNIELYFNFFMNVMMFLHTKLSKIIFLKAENCTSKSAYNIINS